MYTCMQHVTHTHTHARARARGNCGILAVYCGTVVLWYCVAVWYVLWYCGTVVLCVLCTVVLWYCGTV